MDFTRPETVLDLQNIRESLVRMEDTIVFNFIERSQFFQSPSVYKVNTIMINTETQDDKFKNISFLDWFLKESEIIHGKIRRYEAPDEIAFFPNDLEKSILPPINYPQVLAPYFRSISINDEIKDIYTKEIIPLISKPGEQPENLGSCATVDIDCLQSLSRRIHFGNFVAEAKFRTEREKFTQLIINKDIKGLDKAITNSIVEEKILERLEKKANAYGTDPTLRYSQKQQGKVEPKVVTKIYKEWIIPLTKKVEIEYLLRRLESEPSN